jgi:adenosylcobinamide-GDP ribazoletransferase
VSAIGDPLAAVRFLTRLPLPGGAADDAPAIRDSLHYFPLVGLGIGGLLAAADVLLREVVARPVVDALLLIALAVLTGLLHLDGLADSADGLLCQATSHRRLEIMRDSSIGAFGAAALVLVLLLQYSALSAIPLQARSTALIMSGLGSRWGIVLLAACFPYARNSGTGRAIREGANPARTAAATLLAMVCAILVSGPGGLLMLALVAAQLAVFGAYASRRLGGLTGDVYGAGVIVSECVLLISAPVILEAGSTWFS